MSSLLLPLLMAVADDQGEGGFLPFEEVRMTLERNETDGDTEVVLFAKAQDEGLASLVVIAPNGRRVAWFHGDRRGIGLREFALESAEPPDLAQVLASFPQGTYRFHGRTVGGDRLRGLADLSHAIAPATTLLAPDEDEVVPIDEVVLQWSAVPGAVRYVVELENEDLGNEHCFEILPPITTLPVPAFLLVPDSEYQFEVSVVAQDGNVTAVESSFFTAVAAQQVDQ